MESRTSAKNEASSSQLKFDLNMLFLGRLANYLLRSEKTPQSIRYALDVHEHVEQTILGIADIAGDIWNLLPGYLRGPQPFYDRSNAMNKLIFSAEEEPRIMIIPSLDPFGDNEIILLPTPESRQQVAEIMKNGGFINPGPFRYEPIFASNNPFSSFLRSTTTHLIEIYLVSRLPWLRGLGLHGRTVAGHFLVDFNHADGTLVDKIICGGMSAGFAHYVDPLFHIPHNPFDLKYLSLIDRIKDEAIKFFMEGFLHKINHDAQHAAVHVIHSANEWLARPQENINIPMFHEWRQWSQLGFPTFYPTTPLSPEMLQASFLPIWGSTVPLLPWQQVREQEVPKYLPNVEASLFFNNTSKSDDTGRLNEDNVISTAPENIDNPSVSKPSVEIRPLLHQSTNIGSNNNTLMTSLKKVWGDIQWDIHPVPGGIHIGAISCNNFIKMNCGVGFEISNNLVNDLINRFLFRERLTRPIRRQLFNDEYYEYEIYSVPGNVKQVDIIVKYNGRKSEPHRVDLKKYEPSRHNNKKPILSGVEKGFDDLLPHINEQLNIAKDNYLKEHQEALRQSDHTKAWKLHTKFFSKYKGLNPDLDNFAQVAANNIIEHQIASSSSAQLEDLRQQALKRNSKFANYLPKIESCLDSLEALRIFEQVTADEKPMSYEQACKESDAIRDPVKKADFLCLLAQQQGVALIRQNNISEGRERLRQVIKHDPQNQLAHIEMAASFAKEARKIRQDYLNEREERQEGARFVNNTGKTIPVLQEEVAKGQAQLDKIDAAIQELELHAKQIKPLDEEMQENGITSIDKEIKELQVEKEHAANQLKVDKGFLKCTTNHFNIQVAQMGTDLLFCAADTLILFKWKEDGVKLRNHLKLAQAPLSAGLQLLAHDAYCKMSAYERIVKNHSPESGLSTAVNQGRYVLLTLQVLRGVLRWFERDQKQRPKNPAEWSYVEMTGKYLDEYILPIGQVGLSAASIVANPKNAVAGVLSFSPEILLDVPQVNRFLLLPDPRSRLAYSRFLIGRTLAELREDNNFGLNLSFGVKSLGYITTFQEPIAAGVRSLLAMGLSEKTVEGIFNFPLTLQANTTAWLQQTSFGDIAWIKAWIPGVMKIFTSLVNCCPVFKAGFMARTFIKVSQNSDQAWYKYYSNWVQDYFIRGQQAFAGKTPQEKAMFFKYVKEDVCYLLARIVDEKVDEEKHRPHLQKLYITSLWLQHIHAGSLEMGHTAMNNHCLFNAVAYYCGVDCHELRQRVVKYEQTHRKGLIEKNFITDDKFDAHIRSMEQEKIEATDIEVYALAKLLNRPIIIARVNKTIEECIDALPYKLDEFSGDPIFLHLDKNHYTAILLRGEPYFECNYEKYLVMQKQQQPYLVKEMVKSVCKEVEVSRARLMDTHRFIQAKTEQCQAELKELAVIYQEREELLNETNELLNKRGALIEAISANITLFQSAPPKPTGRIIHGMHFVENSGFTLEEEQGIATLFNQMTI